MEQVWQSERTEADLTQAKHHIAAVEHGESSEIAANWVLRYQMKRRANSSFSYRMECDSALLCRF
jgi:hypothetical protein